MSCVSMNKYESLGACLSELWEPTHLSVSFKSPEKRLLWETQKMEPRWTSRRCQIDPPLPQEDHSWPCSCSCYSKVNTVLNEMWFGWPGNYDVHICFETRLDRTTQAAARDFLSHQNWPSDLSVWQLHAISSHRWEVVFISGICTLLRGRWGQQGGFRRRSTW